MADLDIVPEDQDELVSPHHVLALKCVGILVMMGLTALFCLLPYRTYSCEHRQRLVSFANCFGGGVLFGTIFLHLIPEVSYQWQQYLEMTGREAPLPVAESLEVLGFCLILFIETLFEQLSIRKLKRGVFAEDCEKCNVKHNNIHKLKDISPDECNVPEQQEILSPDKDVLISAASQAKRCVVITNQTHNVWIMLASLFVHSVFEGMAVGVETQMQTVIGLIGAILVHKCAIALTLWSRLISQYIPIKKGIVFAVLLAVGTPLGVILGTALQAELTGSTLLLVVATIQAIATGIFLYITFAEILFPELKKKKDMLYKIPCIVLGIVIIGSATLLHDHTHGHSEQSHEGHEGHH